MSSSYTVPCPYCQGRGKIPGSSNYVAQGWVEADCFHCATSGRVDAEKYECAVNDHNCEGHLRVPNAGKGEHRVLCGFHAAARSVSS